MTGVLGETPEEVKTINKAYEWLKAMRLNASELEEHTLEFLLRLVIDEMERMANQDLQQVIELFFENLNEVGHARFSATRIQDIERDYPQIREWWWQEKKDELESFYDCYIFYDDGHHYQVLHNDFIIDKSGDVRKIQKINISGEGLDCIECGEEVLRGQCMMLQPESEDESEDPWYCVKEHLCEGCFQDYVEAINP